MPPALKMNRAVFLDRDGTIIEDTHYLHRPEQVVIFPGAAPALKRLQNAGFKLIIVSNQSGVGRGYYTVAELEDVNRHVCEELGRHGVRFQKIYFSLEAQTTRPAGANPPPIPFRRPGRIRPEPGRKLHDSGTSFLDLECGWNAGVKKCLLVRTGYGAELERTAPDKLGSAVVVDGLPTTANWIFSASDSTLGGG